ncbi:hypothetical protein WH47_05696 [Habropoda laboriosa]|uniref:Uncharacterized protein n=1 Tax=Habropoda laboriosa TaxID=597456 RepID=A0A0L7QQL5_9HYME|nr:hypothetical protein WH47_05696 [Habropoda laboriosa]
MHVFVETFINGLNSNLPGHEPRVAERSACGPRGPGHMSQVRDLEENPRRYQMRCIGQYAPTIIRRGPGKSASRAQRTSGESESVKKLSQMKNMKFWEIVVLSKCGEHERESGRRATMARPNERPAKGLALKCGVRGMKLLQIYSLQKGVSVVSYRSTNTGLGSRRIECLILRTNENPEYKFISRTDSADRFLVCMVWCSEED